MTTRIDEIRGRLNAATPGPWFDQQIRDNDPNPANHNASDGCWWVSASGDVNICDLNDGPDEANAALIANAPTDLAWLLDEVTRLRAALEVAIVRDPWAPVADPHGVFCECSDCDEDRAQGGRIVKKDRMMDDADERAQSQADGADKRDDGFVRRLLVADVRGQIGTANFETRRMAILGPGFAADVVRELKTDDAAAAHIAGVRPLVLDWARKIEACLRRNEGPPKNKGPWDGEHPINFGQSDLAREQQEVVYALAEWWITKRNDRDNIRDRAQDVTDEAVDESVCAMILADLVRPGGPSKDRGWTL